MNKENLFLETLKVSDGHFVRPELHLLRMRATLKEVGAYTDCLPSFLDSMIPSDRRQGVVKCRCLYDGLVFRTEFEPYCPRRIKSLKAVEGGDIDYHLKYADRSAFEKLLRLKGECDDILVLKDGYITDTSYSNVVFSDGERYVTPSSFLLDGTKRRSLLASGKIREEPLTINDLHRFKTVFLINAMLDMDSPDCRVCIPCGNIVL